MNRILENKNLPSESLMGKGVAENKNNLKVRKIGAIIATLFFVFFVGLFSLDCSPALAVDGNNASTTSNTAVGTKPVDNEEKKETSILAKPFIWAFQNMLVGVQSAVSWLLAIAATLFSWAIEPANISGPNGILNKQAVKDVWVMVRDLLNMTFILILLFAAFCTIFQVEKWNLKKVWLNILINALLVNFSYPIARFFIDVSNVAFYYFVNNLFSSTGGTVTGNTIFAKFGTAVSLTNILTPTDFAQNDIAFQIMMIVVTFIVSMTLLIVAALFIVRLIALTMLVMFSPIGFVGYIFPQTASFADKWWSQLFSYSFFAPIMIFVIAIALRVADALRLENMQSMMQSASANTPADQTNWIGHVAFFVIPVIILWMGMGIAKSMGIAGADTVVGGAQKFSKWAGSNLSGYNAARWFGTKAVPSMAGASARWVDRNVLKSWSPRAIIAGWNAQTKDAENKHLSVGTGKWHDNFNKLFRNGKTNYGAMAEHQLIAKRQKELLDGGMDESADQLYNVGLLLGKGSKNAQTDLQAFFRDLVTQNNHDDLMVWAKENIDEGTEVGKKLGKMGINKNNYDVSGENVAHLITKVLGASGLDKEHIDEHLLDLGSVAAGKGGIMYGAVSVNKEGEKVRNFHVDADGNVDGLAMAERAAGKIMTTPDAQNVPKTMHRNYFIDENHKLNDSGRALLRKYASPSAIEQIGRHKSDFIAKVGGDGEISRQMLEYAKELMDGTAMEIGADGKTRQAIGKSAKNDDQALKAAAWTVALQKKAGVAEPFIKSQLSAAGFDSALVLDIMARSKDKGAA
ncbi:MAG: hypothetical protein ACD_8C00096G0001 [uncultured bacterium]|nr:MAG: hypothetical protein ACD_8C00096G0001 [uncultured bacterium]